MIHFPAYHERKLTDGTHVFVATTGGSKRDGLELDMTGGQFDNYLRNPVFLWAHDYGGRTLPIGKVVKLQSSKSKLRAWVMFDQEDHFALEVERKYDEGYLSAVSVGWIDVERDRDTGIITKWDLLDISAVPVPGDPDALIERELALVRSFIEEHEEKPSEPEMIVEEAAEEAAVLEVRAAIPPHTTGKADEDTDWNGPAEVAKAEGKTQLRLMHAWVDGEADQDTKQAYKLPHHLADGRVVWKGVAAAMARLFQQNTLIPDSDRQGVWRHLERHYRQFDKTAPELRTVDGLPTQVVAGMFYHDEWGHMRSELAELIEGKLADLEAAIAAFKETGPDNPIPQEDGTAEALKGLNEMLKEIQ